MSSYSPIFESNHKKLGLVSFNSDTVEYLNGETSKNDIKVAFVPPGYSLMVDFNFYETKHPALFFINTHPHLTIQSANEDDAFLIHYNRDFYCIFHTCITVNMMSMGK